MGHNRNHLIIGSNSAARNVRDIAINITKPRTWTGLWSAFVATRRSKRAIDAQVRRQHLVCTWRHGIHSRYTRLFASPYWFGILASQQIFMGSSRRTAVAFRWRLCQFAVQMVDAVI